MIVSFEQMLEKAKQGEPMVLAGAAAQDVDTIKAMAAAEEAGMIRPVLVGDIPTIERVMKEEGVTFRNSELVQADDMVEACAKAVELVRLGKADFLMKGLVDTNIFLKAILNKETGLPVHVAEDPLSAVAEGTGKVLSELAFLKKVTTTDA